MRHRARVVSVWLLVAGLLLVFTGLSAALAFTVWGVLASAAAVAALLYAGAVWGAHAPAAPPARPLIVFDRDRRVVSGSDVGVPLETLFPEFLRAELRRRCAEALGGTPVRFVCLQNGQAMHYDVLPARNADGLVVYGLLVTAESSPALVGAGV